MTFKEKLAASVQNNNSLLCVGLDTTLDKIPNALRAVSNPIFSFNKSIIDTTADYVCAYKPNTAFYEAYGADGIAQLQMTCNYITEKYPDIPIIIDAKRGDIGNTSAAYAHFVFDYLGGDAVTLAPYMGKESLAPFMEYRDKGLFVLCRTSNDGAEEFQDLALGEEKLYEIVAKNVAENWNTNQNCHLVVGATKPEELAKVRALVGDDIQLLVPGVGAQGGDVEATVKAGSNTSGAGIIVNSSRGIIYASNGDDYAEAAQQAAIKLRDEINIYR